MVDVKRQQGYSFIIETHKVNGKAYSCLYLWKGRGGKYKREHIHLYAKNLEDYRDRVLINK